MFNTHLLRFMMTVCEVLVMENKGTIHVRHRRLLSADNLCDFEQVYALPCPIWPWYNSQPAICPILIPLTVEHQCVCVCHCLCGLCVRLWFQVKLVLYNHGYVSSLSAHHGTRIAAFDIEHPPCPSPSPFPPSLHTNTHTIRVIIQ